ncbi:hypothetical protein V7S43_004884 [Phytophthora oleae]|uniref:Uncharacterized protein n=1 Tax=Phytophthora oleae TaxID=2107226 RepID=A0ABD3FY33_9STRA
METAGQELNQRGQQAGDKSSEDQDEDHETSRDDQVQMTEETSYRRPVGWRMDRVHARLTHIQAYDP